MVDITSKSAELSQKAMATGTQQFFYDPYSSTLITAEPGGSVLVQVKGKTISSKTPAQVQIEKQIVETKVPVTDTTYTRPTLTKEVEEQIAVGLQQQTKEAMEGKQPTPFIVTTPEAKFSVTASMPESATQHYIEKEGIKIPISKGVAEKIKAEGLILTSPDAYQYYKIVDGKQIQISKEEYEKLKAQEEYQKIVEKEAEKLMQQPDFEFGYAFLRSPITAWFELPGFSLLNLYKTGKVLVGLESLENAKKDVERARENISKKIYEEQKYFASKLITTEPWSLERRQAVVTQTIPMAASIASFTFLPIGTYYAPSFMKTAGIKLLLGPSPTLGYITLKATEIAAKAAPIIKEAVYTGILGASTYTVASEIEKAEKGEIEAIQKVGAGGIGIAMSVPGVYTGMKELIPAYQEWQYTRPKIQGIYEGTKISEKQAFEIRKFLTQISKYGEVIEKTPPNYQITEEISRGLSSLERTIYFGRLTAEPYVNVYGIKTITSINSQYPYSTVRELQKIIFSKPSIEPYEEKSYDIFTGIKITRKMTIEDLEANKNLIESLRQNVITVSKNFGYIESGETGAIISPEKYKFITVVGKGGSKIIEFIPSKELQNIYTDEFSAVQKIYKNFDWKLLPPSYGEEIKEFYIEGVGYTRPTTIAKYKTIDLSNVKNVLSRIEIENKIKTLPEDLFRTSFGLESKETVAITEAIKEEGKTIIEVTYGKPVKTFTEITKDVLFVEPVKTETSFITSFKGIKPSSLTGAQKDLYDLFQAVKTEGLYEIPTKQESLFVTLVGKPVTISNQPQTYVSYTPYGTIETVKKATPIPFLALPISIGSYPEEGVFTQPKVKEVPSAAHWSLIGTITEKKQTPVLTPIEVQAQKIISVEQPSIKKVQNIVNKEAEKVIQIGITTQYPVESEREMLLSKEIPIVKPIPGTRTLLIPTTDLTKKVKKIPEERFTSWPLHFEKKGKRKMEYVDEGLVYRKRTHAILEPKQIEKRLKKMLRW